jgi:hypothetical protein
MKNNGDDTMLMVLWSRLIFTLIGVTSPIAAHLADMNRTYIYNPHWPPHAKFHNGQTLSRSLLLGGLTIFLAWWPSNHVRAMVAVPAAVASSYFISQSTAILYPNTAYFDPEFKPQTVRGVGLAVFIDVVYLSAVVVAFWWGFREVR